MKSVHTIETMDDEGAFSFSWDESGYVDIVINIDGENEINVNVEYDDLVDVIKRLKLND